jgi:hypothetical protein
MLRVRRWPRVENATIAFAHAPLGVSRPEDHACPVGPANRARRSAAQRPSSAAGLCATRAQASFPTCIACPRGKYFMVSRCNDLLDDFLIVVRQRVRRRPRSPPESYEALFWLWAEVLGLRLAPSQIEASAPD